MKPKTEIKKDPGGEVARMEPTRSMPYYRPNVDIIEREDRLDMKVDLPGTNSEDIHINFDRGSLTIYAKVQQRQPDGTNFLLREYGVADFYRSFQVGETMDTTRIDAKYSNGVLRLLIPKREEAKARKIEVKSK
jgi:HSP20 family molecular chaperone IbpA